MKPVSPLIASILLITLTVSIGAMIIGWGRQYVQQKTGCLGVGFEILAVNFDGSSMSNIEVLNTGNLNFTAGSSFVFIVENAAGQRISDTQTLTGSWGPGEIKKFYVSSSLDVSSIATQRPLKVWMFYSKCSESPSNVYLIS